MFLIKFARLSTNIKTNLESFIALAKNNVRKYVKNYNQNHIKFSFIMQILMKNKEKKFKKIG